MNIKAGVLKKTFEWFCCLVVFLIFKDFSKLNTEHCFFGLGKFCPTPGEFDHHFLPRGRELDKKMPGWPGLARSKRFSLGLPGGVGCTQFEMTET